MGPSLDKLRRNKKLMAYTAAAMYGGGAFDGSIEGFIPGDPSFAIAPVLVAIAMTALLVAYGPRLPRRVLAPLGPIGVVLIAYALSATPGAGDGAVLYIWPVLWTTFFFGRRGAISIVACIGVAHAVTLLLLPAASSYPGRWVDVMASVSVVSVVILTLVNRNDQLLTQLTDEARTDALTGLLNRRNASGRRLGALRGQAHRPRSHGRLGPRAPSARQTGVGERSGTVVVQAHVAEPVLVHPRRRARCACPPPPRCRDRGRPPVEPRARNGRSG